MLLEQIKSKIQQYFIAKTDFLSVKDKLSEEQLRAYVSKAINEICRKEEIDLTEEERVALIREFVSAVVSYGPIRALLEDNAISEIMINGHKQVFIQKDGRITLSDVQFDDDRHLVHTIQKILAASGSGRRVDESSPYVDFSLNDGSRVNVILPPVSLSGPIVTIRKFSSDISKIEDLLGRRMLNKPMAEFLLASIKAKLNIVFCGATGTGKTTLIENMALQDIHAGRGIGVIDPHGEFVERILTQIPPERAHFKYAYELAGQQFVIFHSEGTYRFYPLAEFTEQVRRNSPYTPESLRRAPVAEGSAAEAAEAA